MPSLFSQALRTELGLYKKFPLLIGAAFVLMLVPALYSLIYISSIWDPYGNLKSLPVCFANFDAGINFRGQQIQMGKEVEKTLKGRRDFLYQDKISHDDLKTSVDHGDCYFGVIVPQQFSAFALPGRHAQPARLEIYLSEGNSFMASMVARKFGSELTHKLNETLNRKRWEILLDKLDSSSVGIAQLKLGSLKLKDGAHRLDEGSKLLAEKNAELTAGLGKIQDGAQRLKEGANKMKVETAKILIVGSKISAGAQQLEDGLEQLLTGITLATEGSKKLTDGASQLHDGIGQVAAGLDLMSSKIPSKVELPEGDADGLSASIAMNVDISSSVQTNGEAFTPYFTALSLWVGAVMITFIFQLQTLSAPFARLSQWKILCSKIALALPILLGQVSVITFSLIYFMKIQIIHPFLFWSISLTGSLVFFSLILTLITTFGDFGRILALIFLIFQLGAAGGAFPVELSGGIFAQAHPYLPITELVKALRALLFNAYAGEWYFFWSKLAGLGLLIFLIAWGAGRRWKYVALEDYKPALDLK